MKLIRPTNPPRSPFFKGGIAVGALVALFVLGCRSSSSSPQGVAEDFIDQHYVQMDLKAAQAYTTGVAWQKVEEEKRLIGDQQIDASTRKPRVTYRLKEEVASGGEASSFVFEGTIQVDGADEFTRQWLVNTRKEADGAWKVSNFSEYEAVLKNE